MAVSSMKYRLRFLVVFSLLVACRWSAGQELVERQTAIRDLAEKSGVTVTFDLPYAGTENPKQRVDLYLPKERKRPGPLPVVALIHGGGWVNGDRIGYGGLALQLARTGDYAAVTVGYRLTNEARWPAQIHDCKAAIRLIRGMAAQHGLDPDRIGVWGSSAGGHLCTLLGTSGGVKELEGDLGPHLSQSSRVSCVVNHCGPQDFREPLMRDPAGQPNFQDDAVSGLLGGLATEKVAEAVAASPITYVSADDPPIVTGHGTADARVAYAHAEMIHAALKKAGVASWLIPVTGGGHGSVSHPVLKERCLTFLSKQMLGAEATIDESPIPAEPGK